MEDDAELEGIDDSLRHFKALSEALDERLRKRELEHKWDPILLRSLASGPPPKGDPTGAAGAATPGDVKVQDDGAAQSESQVAMFLAVRASPAPSETAQAQTQLQPPDTARVRFKSITGSPQSMPPYRHNAAAMPARPAVLAASQSISPSVRPIPPMQLSIPVPAPAADYTSLLRSTLESPRASGPSTAAASPMVSPSKMPSRHPMMTGSTSAPTVAAALAAAAAAAAGPAAAASTASPPHHANVSTYTISQQQAAAAAAMQHAAAATGGSGRGGGIILAGQVQYRDLLAAAQAASRDGGARTRAFHMEMEQIDAEIDAYVGDYKFEQYAPDAALAVQTAWRARKVRVFFNRYCAVRRKHLQRQLALVFGPLKQLVLAVLHARRRMLRRAFEEWRDWVWLGNELFFKLMAKLRASIGSVKEYATPQQLWQLCTPPGGDPWTARLTLGALVANVLIRQMPHRTLALYLGAWRRAVALQVAKRQKAGEVLRRMEHKRFWEYVRLLFRFWFRWSVIRVSERLQIPPPIFRPRILEWDEWLFRHMRSRELHSRMVQLHKGFRVRHFFDFWLFFTRRNKRMREAWYSTAAHHIEAILRNAVNAFKANLAEGRRLRRVKRAVFEGILHLTRRNKTVRRIAKEVHEISIMSQRRLTFRRLREWARANRMLRTATTIQIMARRPLCLIPIYAMLDDIVHMRFMWCWIAWRNYTLGRLRMRCLLGLHLSRANTAHMEIAFKALRKWAELQRMERAREVLKQLRPSTPPPQLPPPPRPATEAPAGFVVAAPDATSNASADRQGRGVVAGEVAVSQLQRPEVQLPSPPPPPPQRQQQQQHPHVGSPSVRLSNAGSGSTAAVGVSATITTISSCIAMAEAAASTESGDEEEEHGDFELFVSLADYPLPPGGTWRSPLDKAEIMRRPPAFATDPAMAMSAAAAAVAAATSRLPSTPITSSISGAMGSGALELHGSSAIWTMPGGGTSTWVSGTNMQLASPAAAASGMAGTGVGGTAAQVQATNPQLVSVYSSAQCSPQLLQYNLMAFVSKIQELLQQLLNLEGPFSAQGRGKRLVLTVNPQRPLANTQRTWVEMDNPVSNIFLSQGRPDPGLWQRLVGLLVCGVPHPDHPGAHLVDQSRLPFSNRAASIRRTALMARLNVPDDIPIAACQGDSAGGGAASISGASGGNNSGEGSGSSVSISVSSSGGDASRGGSMALGIRRPGILLEEQDQDAMLIHRLCEAEDFLDSCVHVLLGLGGMETPLLRRAIGAVMPHGTLLGDALAAILQPALQADLNAMAANLRHRTHRDRIITLGVDLADKARTYASHRPEFTLTKRDRRGTAVGLPGTAASRAAAAAAAIAARLTGGGGGSPLPVTASASLEQGVVPLTSAMAAMAAALAGPPPPGPGGNTAGAPKAPDDDEDMDIIRARRRAAAIAQAEAAAAAVAAAAKAAAAAAAASAAAGGGGSIVNPTPPSTADAQGTTPSPGGTPRRWRPVKAAGLSKSAVIRMEMLAGRSSPANSVPPSSTPSPAMTPGGGAAAGVGAGQAMSSRAGSLSRHTSGLRNERSPGASPMRAMRTIAFSTADKGHSHDASASAAGAVAGTGATGSTDPPSPARSRLNAVSRRASLRSQTSFGRVSPTTMSTRALLAESSAFSFAVRDAQISPGETPVAAGQSQKHGAGQQHGQGQQRGSGPALIDAADPDGAPHSPRPDATAGGVDKHATVNNFLHMTPPGFLSAGKVLNPANFPWPREIPSQEMVQIKADFVLRATLPNLNAMPKLPDIVFGPLGDPPGTQLGETEPSTEPSLISHGSINSSRALALAEAAAAAAAAVSGGESSGGGTGSGGGAAAAAAAAGLLGELPGTAFSSAGGAVAAAAAAAAAVGGVPGNNVWSLSGAVGDLGNDNSGSSLGLGSLATGWSRRSLMSAQGNASGQRLGTDRRSNLSFRGTQGGQGGMSHPGDLRPQPRRNPSVLSSVRGMYGASSSIGLDKELLAVAVAARRERRTQLTVLQLIGQDVLQDSLVYSGPMPVESHQPLPGLAEGRDGEEGEDREAEVANAEVMEAAAAVAAKRAALRSSMPVDLLSMEYEKAARQKGPSEPKGIATAFRDFSLKRKSIDGDIGSDIDSVNAGTPQASTPGAVSGHSGDESQSEPPTPGRISSNSGGTNGSAAKAAGASSGGRPQAGGRPQFRVTTRQLNIFMGAHLRRGSSTGMRAAASLRIRDKQRKGLTLTADGILVTPFGVQVVREVEEEGEDSDAVPNRRGGSIGAAGFHTIDPRDPGAATRGNAAVSPLGDGLRRIRTVVVREFANSLPFEHQYNFKKSVWMPPEQRRHMLDDYDLETELASGRAGELAPPFLEQLMAPPADSPFLQEFEAELTRTRVGVQRRAPQSHPDRQRAWSRLSRGASVISRISANSNPSASRGAAASGGRDSSDSSTTTRRRRTRRPVSRYSRRRFPIADSAFLSSSEEGEGRGLSTNTSIAASRVANEPYKPYVDDLFDEDYAGGVNISQAAAVATAVTTTATTREDQTIMQLVRMGAPGFQLRQPPVHVPPNSMVATLAASVVKDELSPWSSGDGNAATSAALATTVPTAKPALLTRHLSSASGSVMSNASGGPRGSVALSRGTSARAAAAAATAEAAVEASNSPAAMLQRTIALEAAVGGSVYDLEVARLPNLTEAAELLGSMFSSIGPSRPTSAKVVRSRSVTRKRGNLRTGKQTLQDPLMQPSPPSAPMQLTPAASPDGKMMLTASGSTGGGSGRWSRLANGTDEDEAQSEPSVSPSEAGSTSSLRGEVTLSAFGFRSPGRGGAMDGAVDAAAEQHRQEEEQHAALMRDDGVRRQLEALRAMWTSDPYSARPGVDPAGLSPPPPNLGAAAAVAAAAAAAAGTAASAKGGSSSINPPTAATAGADRPVRIGGGLARALAEARVEQWALYDRSVEHMAREFARAMQQLGPDGDATGQEGEDSSFMSRMSGMFSGSVSKSPYGGIFDRTRPTSSNSAGPGPGSAASRRRQYDAAFRRQRSRRSSVGGDDASSGMTTASGQSTPLTGHATRGLLDTLEEALATALDPVSLTGLNLQEYDQHLSDLMQRLVVAPAASKYMFWKKVQTVQQLRGRMMEDRAMAEQLRNISWAGSFNAHHMAPRGTDAATGRSGPFAAEALAYSDGCERRRLQEGRIAAVRKLRMEQARALRQQRAVAAAQTAEAAAVGGGSNGGAAPPPHQEPVAMEPSLALPGGGNLSEEPTPQIGRKAAGDLIGRRAAWVPLISLPPPPLDQWNQPVEPQPVLERIVAPARLLPKPAAATATASARDILPRRNWRRRRRGATILASATALSRRNFARPRSAPRPGFRSTLLAAHPDDQNRVLDHTHDEVPLNGATVVAGLTEGRPLWCAAAAVGGQLCTRSEPGRSGPKRRFKSYVRQLDDDDDDEYEDEEWEGQGDRDGDGQDDEEGEDKEEEDEDEEDEHEDPEAYGGVDGNSYYRDSRAGASQHVHGDTDGFSGWVGSGPRRPRSQPTTREGQWTAAANQPGGTAAATTTWRRGGMPMYMLPTASTAARRTGVPAARKAAARWLTSQGHPKMPGGNPNMISDQGQSQPDQVPSAYGVAAVQDSTDRGEGGSVREGHADDGDMAQPEMADGDGGGDGNGGVLRKRAKRPRLTAAKLQLALARRAELRAQLEARGELLELDEMDLEELEEEADLVDRLVEASIRVYGAAMARRAAQIDGTVAPATGALAVPGEGVLLAGRGHALGWVLPGPAALQRGDGRVLLPSDPWRNPVAGYGAAVMAAQRSAAGASAAGSPLLLAGVPAGGGAAAASHLATTVRANKAPSSLPKMADDPEHRHLPHPSGQQRPVGPPPAPLAPLATPKSFPAVSMQPGNLRFPSPVSGAATGDAANPLRNSAPAGLSSTLPPGSLRPVRTPVTGPAGLLPLSTSPSTTSCGGGSRLGSATAGDVGRLPPVLQGGGMSMPARGEPHLLPPVEIPVHGISGSIGVPGISRLGRVSTTASGSGLRPHLDPIPDPPRPHSAGINIGAIAAAAAAAGAATVAAQPLLLSPKTGSAGSLTAAVAAVASKQAALKPPGSPPAVVPPLDWVRARSPATGLVGLVGIGETPSIAAAAMAAGPVTGLEGSPAPVEILSPLSRSSRTLSPGRQTLSPTRGGAPAQPAAAKPPLPRNLYTGPNGMASAELS